MDYKNYKYCIVPCCKNTTINTKEKLFLSVPKNAAKRKAWTRAMKRDEKLNKKLSSLTSLWCCEDHFSLPEDMENYWQWKLTKDVKRIQLKPGVVPHIFDCQKKNVQSSVERTAVKKRKQMSLIQDALMAYNASQNDVPNTIAVNTPAISLKGNISMDYDPFTVEKCIQVNLKKPFRSKGTNTFITIMKSVGCSTSKTDVNVGMNISSKKLGQQLKEQFFQNCASFTSDFNTSDVKRIQLKSGNIPHTFDSQKKKVPMHIDQNAFIDCSTSQYDVPSTLDFDAPSTCISAISSTSNNAPNTSSISPEDNTSIDCDSHTVEKYVQVNIKKPVRSIGTNTYTIIRKTVGCSTSNIDASIRTNTSSQKFGNEPYQKCASNTIDFDSIEEESSGNFSSSDEDNQKFNDHMIVGTVMFIEKEPRLYLELPNKKNHYLLLLHYCNS